MIKLPDEIDVDTLKLPEGSPGALGVGRDIRYGAWEVHGRGRVRETRREIAPGHSVTLRSRTDLVSRVEVEFNARGEAINYCWAVCDSTHWPDWPDKEPLVYVHGRYKTARGRDQNVARLLWWREEDLKP